LFLLTQANLLALASAHSLTRARHNSLPWLVALVQYQAT
jgi:hypothetical protein